jgi:hypothetical protein
MHKNKFFRIYFGTSLPGTEAAEAAAVAGDAPAGAEATTFAGAAATGTEATTGAGAVTPRTPAEGFA